MRFNITTNNDYRNLGDIYKKYEEQSKEIYIASAFFSDYEIIHNWLNNDIKVKLIISLRPPTCYYSITKIYNHPNLEIKFYGRNFHSKLSIFNGNDFTGSVIGSSNFTNNGIIKNIETNFSSDDSDCGKKMKNCFDSLWNNAYQLEPYDLEQYKIIFDNYKNYEKEQDEFENEILNNRNKSTKIKICKEAQEYLLFWKSVNILKSHIEEISLEKYPKIPIYLTIDHFWHWIKTKWSKENKSLDTPNYTIIKNAFLSYCEWDLTGDNFTTSMFNSSENIFKQKLSSQNIFNITSEDVLEIYRNLHSGLSRTNRFNSDQKFLKSNGIEKIKKSLNYLLYSKDDIDIKITRMITDDNYRLDELGPSGIQEIIGWVYSEKYPIRNSKADFAIQALGFRI